MANTKLASHPATSTALGARDRVLAEAALSAARNSYAPYSGFAVGSAVRTKSGRVYYGTNLENASYGVGMCAEVAAITAANSAGDFNIEAIAVVGYSKNEEKSKSAIVTPCGRCRQIIFEASQAADVDIRVICGNGDLSKIAVYTISQLLPDGFGPKNLGIDI
jgi:cytidine deaminase